MTIWKLNLPKMTRVVKNGGWIIACPGEGFILSDEDLKRHGFEEFCYKGQFCDVYRYRKRIFK